jgi:PQQ-dependent dehydrogenase (s-GDH family)
MRVTLRSLLIPVFMLVANFVFAQAPANDQCSNATVLTGYSNTCSSTTAGTVLNATNSGISANASCGGTPDDDVWYKFVAVSSSATITLSNINNGNNKLGNATPTLELFAGTCPSGLISLACDKSNSTSITNTTLTSGNTYYIRVYSGDAGFPTSDGSFSICVTYPPPPSNDDCSGATTLTSATSCSNTAGTTVNATASTGLPSGCEAVGTHYDVWYKFIATGTTHTITIGGQGSGFTNPEIQLYSGACGSFTSIACGTTTLTSTLLTVSSTYYIRVSNIGSSPGSNGAFTICVTHPTAPITVAAGRMNEVYKQTILSGSGVLSYPWEIAYGPDEQLWVTESRGYKVYRMDPNTGTKTTVLDLSQGSTWLTSPADSLNVQFSSSQSPWPQGGLAGLALHPKFLDGTGLNDYVYVSYVHRYLGGSSPTGRFFRNKLVRFTYNSGTGKLEAPAVLCDTLPGSNDHNSQRVIIAASTQGGTKYLFYASGDMGAGQFDNRTRPNNAQTPASYEGKILRFNLVSDGDAGAAAWIPNDNPYSPTSAVWSIGIRNNQGFAYDSTLNILYGASHGPYSDDEINIIEPFKNYGHPLIEGFVDGNYNGNSAQGTNTSVSAGAPYTDNSGVSSCPPIGNETTNKTAIDASGNGLYKDPLFSAYAASQATVTNLWQTNPGNALPAPGWPTEAWSGLDLYTHTLIPGWKNSLVAASLKWGRLLRLRLNTTGIATAPTNSVSDTVSYFGSQNRFRDIAFSPNGKDIFVIMDNSSTTSGPGSANPVVPNCAGCVQKYTFLGYYHNSGTNRSTIPGSIDITSGTANTLKSGTTVTIDASNNTLWVPITGPDGNIMAEIKANGNNLGTITSTFYNSGTVREDASKRLYLNRSITITPQNQPSSTVNVRLYFTSAELTALMGATNSQGQGSGVTGIGNIKVMKNSDATPVSLTAATSIITPTYAEAHSGTSNGGYVLQADISSFSSFYFGDPSMITLPLELISFKGIMKENDAHLNWETANEYNTAHFNVERSVDGHKYETIGKVVASGNSNNAKYSYIDYDADKQSSSVLYYRLKMVDKDEDFKQSQIISLAINSSAVPVLVYPNPVNDVLNLRVSLAGNDRVHIQVSDMQGQIIYRKSKYIRNGGEEININTKSWPAQSYSIIVTDSRNKVLVNKKIIKM